LRRDHVSLLPLFFSLRLWLALISTSFPYTTLFRSFFSQISDPRRAQGRRHRLSMVLGIAAGAVLCRMRGYQAISDWAQSLGQKSRERFGCRREEGRYVVPSEYVLRNGLIRLNPAHLDQSLQR